jgi:hypothetical protein
MISSEKATSPQQFGEAPTFLKAVFTAHWSKLPRLEREMRT